MSLDINVVPTTVEVDTGVMVLLMSKEMQSHFFPKATLEEPTIRLTMYTTVSISVVGKVMVQVKYLSYVGRHIACGTG